MAAFVKVPRGLSVSLRCTSTSALAERFGVSSRTIERDLRSLQDAGGPLYATAGRRGGYAILPDFALPPVRLSAQEATACLAALALMDRSPYATHARTAADKLAACLPAADRSAMPVEAVMSVQAPQAATTGAWIDAFHEHHLVALTYLDDSTPRLVEPYTALEAAGHWYLVGWCRTRNAVRGFRVDRIRSLQVTTATFAPTHATDVARDLERWNAAPLN
jgi:predicted DNA-binding transcriptional regulator YafY